MKVVRITTTEFYKNPSKAVQVVKEGGVVYLGYKNLSSPIAVLSDYAKYNAVTEEKKISKKDIDKKRKALLKKLKFKSKYWKSGLDLQNAVRQ